MVASVAVAFPLHQSVGPTLYNMVGIRAVEITAGGNNRHSIDRSSGPARGGAGRSVAVATPTGRRVTLIDRSSGPARGGAGRSVAVAPPTGRRVTLFCPRQSACHLLTVI